jgi:hypothetical protein
VREEAEESYDVCFENRGGGLNQSSHKLMRFFAPAMMHHRVFVSVRLNTFATSQNFEVTLRPENIPGILAASSKPRIMHPGNLCAVVTKY